MFRRALILLAVLAFASCSLRSRNLHRGARSGGEAAKSESEPAPAPAEETAAEQTETADRAPPAPPPAAEVERFDRHGDRLPPGAIARLGTIRFRAAAFTNAIAASPDGARLASVHIDGRLRVFEADSGKLIFSVVAHPDGAKRVAWMREGAELVTAGQDGFARIFDARDGRKLREIAAHKNDARALAVDPRGRSIATGGADKTVQVFDAASGARARSFQDHSDRVDALVYSADGGRLASAGYDGTIVIHDEKPTILRAKTPIYSLAFSEDGKLIAAGGDDTTIAVFELTSGKQIARWKAHTGGVTALAFAGNELVSGGADGRVKKWDFRSGRAVWDAGETVIQEVAALAVIAGKNKLASGGAGGVIRLWRLGDGGEDTAAGGHHDRVGSVVFSPSSGKIVSGGHDGRVRIWDAASAEALKTITGPARPILAVAFAGEAEVAAVGADGAVSRFGATGNQLGVRPAPKGKTDATWRSWARLDGGGSRVAQLIAGTTLVFHETSNTAPLATREVSGRGVGAAVLSDGSLMSIEAAKSTLAIIDAKNNRALHELAEKGEVTAAVMSEDGRRLFIARKKSAEAIANEIVAFDLAGGVKKTVTLPSHHVTGLALSPDGRTLIAASAYTFIRARRGDGRGGWQLDPAPSAEAIAPKVLDASTLELQSMLLGHDGGVESIAFSADSKLVATGGDDTTVLIWALR